MDHPGFIDCAFDRGERNNGLFIMFDRSKDPGKMTRSKSAEAPCGLIGCPPKGKPGFRMMNLTLGMAACLTLHGAPSVSSILLNEIMYHPASEDAREEFLELWNRGSTSVNLRDWQFASGVHWTFPDIELEAGEYLVIAADTERFRALYPDVARVLGNWEGRLSNQGEKLQLLDAGGRVVHEVRYSDDGDWSMRVRAPVDYGHRGWIWQSPADGGGSSLELVNPSLPNEEGQNWLPSRTTGGTPGQANSVLSTNTAPLILDTVHTPPIPASSDPVKISARLLDESRESLSAQVFYRLDGAAHFNTVNLGDDGQHGDGLANDGLWSAILPAQTNGAVVEFYLEARDQQGNRRSWPSPAVEDGVSIQTLNALYQVVDAKQTFQHPLYRLVFRAVDAAELKQINLNWPAAPYPTPYQSPSRSQFNATWISEEGNKIQVRYLAGVCNRGNGSAWRQPQSYRVNFTHQFPWNDVVAVNLNAQYPIVQAAGSAVYRRAGLPLHRSHLAEARVNGLDLSTPGPPSFGVYACNEVINDDFIRRISPNDSGGSIYEGIRVAEPGANLSYLGTNPAPYRVNYFKGSNQSEDNWSDLIELARVLDTTPEAEFAPTVTNVLPVRQWLRYFALETLVVNMETCLGNGYGDDYFLYFGRQDPRALLIAHDLDTIMGQGDTAGRIEENLWRGAYNPRISRLMKAPEFAPMYFEELLDQIEQTFSPAIFHPLLGQTIAASAPTNHLQAMKDFMAARCAFVQSQIPRQLSIKVELPRQNGYYQSTRPAMDISGRADVVRCRAVTVNHQPVQWSAWEGIWWTHNLPLQPGFNTVTVRCFDPSGAVFQKDQILVWHDDGRVQQPPTRLEADATWSPAGGPFWIPQSVTVNPGVTLRILQGATILLGPDAELRIEGRLLMEGTEANPIRLDRQPDSSDNWAGLTFLTSSTTNRLSHVVLSGCAAPSAIIRASNTHLELDHVTFTNTTGSYLDLDSCSCVITDCAFPPTSNTGMISIHAPPQTGNCLLARNQFGQTGGQNDTLRIEGNGEDSPLVIIRDNVFLGTGDDHIDLAGLDAWVAGNLFQAACNSNRRSDSACAIAVSMVGDRPSMMNGIRNVFFQCDYGVQADHSSSFSLAFNTIYGMKFSAILLNAPLQNKREPHLEQQLDLDSNIIWESPAVVIAPSRSEVSSSFITARNNLLPRFDVLPTARNNWVLDPSFKHPPPLEGTTPVSVHDFVLNPNSPALSTGTWGLDRGALIPAGVFLAGGPGTVTTQTDAIFQVGGAGVTHYRFRLDEGPWSEIMPVADWIQLKLLQPGSHHLSVLGFTPANFAVPGEESTVTASWLVDPHATPSPSVRINEILARNRSAQPLNGSYPDLVELHNPGSEPVDLGGMSLSDDLNVPRAFVFPPGSILQAGGFLVLAASDKSIPEISTLGFKLSQEGDRLYLFDTPSRASRLIDTVVFGLQIADHGIGCLPDGSWGLTLPSFGSANIPCPTGNPQHLRINEWMARPFAGNDWLEIRNPDPFPVPLDGLSLTDDLIDVSRHRFPPLSFIGAGQDGYRVFQADNETAKGQDHLAFQLDAEGEGLGLFNLSGEPIDALYFGPQSLGVSQGPFPEPSRSLSFFRLHPSPGIPNQSDSSFQDTDQDGLPDDWEHFFGFNPSDNTDVALDRDQDGMNNLAEYLAGTDPNDPSSDLRLLLQAVPHQGALLSFRTPSRRVYAIESCDDLTEGHWQNLTTIGPLAQSRINTLWLEAPLVANHRYYRLRLVSQPGIQPGW